MYGQTTNELSPDVNATGLLSAPVNALRYDGQLDHPSEVAGMLRALMPSGVRVLDIGCGTGSVTLIANRDRGNDVVCVEPDAQRAEVAKSRGLKVHTGELTEALIAQEGEFDVVMASDELEHLANPSQLLGLMKAALRPKGFILISVPNVAHWSVRANLLLGKFDYATCGIMDATHLRWFTEKTILELLRQNGLSPVIVTQTAGSDIPVYGNRFFRRIPGKFKTSTIRLVTKAAPHMFGVQHVVKAIMS